MARPSYCILWRAAGYRRASLVCLNALCLDIMVSTLGLDYPGQFARIGTDVALECYVNRVRRCIGGDETLEFEALFRYAPSPFG